MDLTRTSIMEPLFPFSFANRELRTLRQLADQMENSFRSADGTQHHVPTYEYQRDANKVQLEVELPGVKQEHIEVELRGSQLCITGRRFKSSDLVVEEHKEGSEQIGSGDVKMDEGKKASLVYELQVKVGENADEAGIKAEHRDGVLKMLIPLKTMTEGRKIAITQG
ncbi:heat-shock protein [Gracilaria domingensis]|nr:heat-shock protein [Gracilaria domingensis]